jgi:outer membrane biosynthesis protein TonB
MSLRSHLRHSSSGRDAALARLRWINRSIIAGSVALTGIFADTAANTFAGGTPHAGRADHGRAASAKHSSSTGAATPLAPPREAPQQAASPQHEPEPEPTPTQEQAPKTSEPAPQAEQPAEAQHAEAPPAPEPAREEAPVISGAS